MNTQGGTQGGAAGSPVVAAGESASEYAIRKIKEDIDYYSRSGRRNKRLYIWTRNTLIVVAALTTFLAALQSADFVAESGFWDIFFKVATPISALVAAIVGGLTNAFQYGAAWRDAIVTGLKLERELNQLELSRYATQAGDRLDPAQVLDHADTLVFEETEQFFERVVGGASAQ